MKRFLYSAPQVAVIGRDEEDLLCQSTFEGRQNEDIVEDTFEW